MRRKQIIVTLLLIVFTFILTVVPTAAKQTSEEAIYAAKTKVNQSHGQHAQKHWFYSKSR